MLSRASTRGAGFDEILHLAQAVAIQARQTRQVQLSDPIRRRSDVADRMERREKIGERLSGCESRIIVEPRTIPGGTREVTVAGEAPGIVAPRLTDPLQPRHLQREPPVARERRQHLDLRLHQLRTKRALGEPKDELAVHQVGDVVPADAQQLQALDREPRNRSCFDQSPRERFADLTLGDPHALHTMRESFTRSCTSGRSSRWLRRVLGSTSAPATPRSPWPPTMGRCTRPLGGAERPRVGR